MKKRNLITVLAFILSVSECAGNVLNEKLQNTETIRTSNHSRAALNNDDIQRLLKRTISENARLLRELYFSVETSASIKSVENRIHNCSAPSSRLSEDQSSRTTKKEEKNLFCNRRNSAECNKFTQPVISFIMASERYSFSLTTFSPSGKLVQIEYALAAVAAGAPSVGIKASNGIVLATENKHKSVLYEEHSVSKVELITKHIGMVYSGMGPDYRLLVKRARKMAQQYQLIYQEPIPTAQLVQRVAMVMQEYTQSGGVRPFGVSLLICGWDEGKPYLFQCDPSGAYFAWKATAMGKNFINGKTFLEKRYSEDLELDDAVHTAILTLKEGFEGQMTADNIEVGICDADGFRRLDPSSIKDYLANIP